MLLVVGVEQTVLSLGWLALATAYTVGAVEKGGHLYSAPAMYGQSVVGLRPVFSLGSGGKPNLAALRSPEKCLFVFCRES